MAYISLLSREATLFRYTTSSRPELTVNVDLVNGEPCTMRRWAVPAPVARDGYEACGLPKLYKDPFSEASCSSRSRG